MTITRKRTLPGPKPCCRSAMCQKPLRIIRKPFVSHPAIQSSTPIADGPNFFWKIRRRLGRLGTGDSTPSQLRICVCRTRARRINPASLSSRAGRHDTGGVPIAPRYAEPYLLRGLAKLEIGDLVGALSDTSISITLDTTNAEAYLARGLVYLALNELKNARHDFSKAGEGISPALLQQIRERQTEKDT